MCTKYIPSQFVKVLRENMLRHPGKEIKTPKFASVAAVICPNKDKDVVELLFLRRKVNKRDRWSGQMAFPGGKQNPRESLLQTAIRETKEEINLDLSNDLVEVLGQLDDRLASISLGVRTYVFICHNKDKFMPTLQDDEIQDIVWVDLAFLANKQIFHTHKFRTDKMIPIIRKNRILKVFNRCFGHEEISFPTIYLPRPDEPTNNITEEKKRNIYDFVLWGLTLSMTSDLLRMGGLTGYQHIKIRNHERLLKIIFEVYLNRRVILCLSSLGIIGITIVSTCLW